MKIIHYSSLLFIRVLNPAPRVKIKSYGDDGARGERVLDLPGLGAPEGHDHLHGLELDVGLVLLHVRAVRVQVADHLLALN